MSSSSQVDASLQDCAGVVPKTLHGYLHDFKNLYEDRLWHQLSERIQAFYREEAAQPSLPTVFSSFVALLEKNMNPMTFVKLAIETARQVPCHEAQSLLADVAKRMKALPEASGGAGLYILATMEEAHYRLVAGDQAGARKAIEECADEIETLAGADMTIPGTFYRVSADYDKATMNFSAYYRNSLRYLACVQVSDLPIAAAQERAHDLCVAALLGETIYNFGELFAHPILQTLKETRAEFLLEALSVFNSGNHGGFAALQAQFNQHALLKTRPEFLQQKICLMALVEVIFCQLKVSRSISFAQISEATQVPVQQVEFLLMKALSIKLIRGYLDEPRQCFLIEWVQPRALDMKQIGELRVGLQEWRKRVQQTSSLAHSLLPSHVH